MKLLDKLFGKRPEYPFSRSVTPLRSGAQRSALRRLKNDFAFKLFHALREREGNLCFSPFSVRVALGLASAGARGETAAQMCEVLGIGASQQTFHETVATLLDDWRGQGDGDCEFSAANALWCDRGMSLLPEFLDFVERHYAGSAQQADFRHEPESARTKINDWVANATRQKIRDLVPRGGVDSMTRLVIANALYMNGRWERPFEASATREEPFHRERGGSIPVPLMHQSHRRPYARGEGFQMVELAYSGRAVSMLVLLPENGLALSELERLLSADALEECIGRLATHEVRLVVPKFTGDWFLDLAPTLVEHGMPLAFTQAQADFSAICGCPPGTPEALFLSSVLHRARVEVDEQGTVASAATVIMAVDSLAMKREPPPIVEFRVDRPFLYVIRHRETGGILFLGRVLDPTKN